VLIKTTYFATLFTLAFHVAKPQPEEGESNSSECGNPPENSAELSHDPAPLRSPKDYAPQKLEQTTTIMAQRSSADL